MRATPHSKASPAFVLFEVMLALIIFAVAVVGLARALNDTIGVSNSLIEERAIRMTLESFLNEVRTKEVREMNTEIVDETKGISFVSVVEQQELTNIDDRPLGDLYLLTGTAIWSSGTRETTAELLIYKPRVRR